MSELIVCAVAEAGDQVHRYVAERMDEGERDAFEAHLLECDSCQTAVREGRALRAALTAGAADARRPWRALWLAPAVAAAALVVWLIGPADADVRRLGQLDAPPAFHGVPVRSSGDSAAVLADAGLTAYREARFDEAAELLAAAAALEPGPAASFFLGVARLWAGDRAGARSALRDARSPTGNPYAAEAAFYLAKAWLQEERADSALAALGTVPEDAGAVSAHAAALADSVRRLAR